MFYINQDYSKLPIKILWRFENNYNTNAYNYDQLIPVIPSGGPNLNPTDKPLLNYILKSNNNGPDINFQTNDSGYSIILLNDIKIDDSITVFQFSMFLLDIDNNYVFTDIYNNNYTFTIRPINCNNDCLTFINDNDNCGKCGNKCPVNTKCCGQECVKIDLSETCNVHDCYKTCGPGFINCGGTCLSTDNVFPDCSSKQTPPPPPPTPLVCKNYYCGSDCKTFQSCQDIKCSDNRLGSCNLLCPKPLLENAFDKTNCPVDNCQAYTLDNYNNNLVVLNNSKYEVFDFFDYAWYDTNGYFYNFQLSSYSSTDGGIINLFAINPANFNMTLGYISIKYSKSKDLYISEIHKDTSSSGMYWDSGNWAVGNTLYYNGTTPFYSNNSTYKIPNQMDSDKCYLMNNGCIKFNEYYRSKGNAKPISSVYQNQLKALCNCNWDQTFILTFPYYLGITINSSVVTSKLLNIVSGGIYSPNNSFTPAHSVYGIINKNSEKDYIVNVILTHRDSITNTLQIHWQALGALGGGWTITISSGSSNFVLNGSDDKCYQDANINACAKMGSENDKTTGYVFLNMPAPGGVYKDDSINFNN